MNSLAELLEWWQAQKDDAERQQAEFDEKYFPGIAKKMGMSPSGMAADMAGATQGITRLNKNLIAKGTEPLLASALDREVKNRMGSKTPFINGWQYVDVPNKIGNFRRHAEKMIAERKAGQSLIDKLLGKKLPSIAEDPNYINAKDFMISGDGPLRVAPGQNMTYLPEVVLSPPAGKRYNVANLPDKNPRRHLSPYPTDLTAEFQRERMQDFLDSKGSGILDKRLLKAMTENYAKKADAAISSKWDDVHGKWVKKYSEKLFRNNEKVTKYGEHLDRKAIAKVKRAANPYIPELSDEVKAGQKAANKYAEEYNQQQKALFNLFDNAKKAPIKLPEPDAVMSKIPDSIARPEAKVDDISNYIERTIKDAKKFKRGEEARILQEASENYSMNHGGRVPEPKPYSFMDDVFEDFKKLDNIEPRPESFKEHVKSTAKYNEYIDKLKAAAPTKFNMKDAGTLFTKAQRKKK